MTDANLAPDIIWQYLELADASAAQRTELIESLQHLIDTEGYAAIYRARIEQLFARQMQTLEQLAFPDTALTRLHEQRTAVLDTSERVGCTFGNTPFVLVVPPPFVSIFTHASCLRIGSAAGYSYLNPYTLYDVHEKPTWPYAIYDVAPGFAFRNTAPAAAETALSGSGRRGLSLTELLSLALHRDLGLDAGYLVDALDTRQGAAEHIPFLSLDANRIVAAWHYGHVPAENGGVPTCAH